MSEPSRLPFHVSFSEYLASELIILTYLPYPNETRRFYRGLVIWILLVNLFIYNIRHVIFLLIDKNSPWNLYLGDPDYALGLARDPMNLVYLDWNLIGWIIGIYIKYTQYITKRQRWRCLDQLFSKGHFHGATPHPMLMKSFFVFTTFQRVSAVVIATSAFIPYLYWSPKKFWVNGILAGIHQGFVAFMTSAYLCNTAPLFALSAYMYGEFFKSQARIWEARKVEDYMSGSKYAEYLLKIYKEMIESYLFYQPINAIAFVGTYIAAILILFYVFFTDMDFRVKVVFCSFFFLNQNSGQTFHFLASSLAYKKVGHLMLSSILTTLCSR